MPGQMKIPIVATTGGACETGAFIRLSLVVRRVEVAVTVEVQAGSAWAVRNPDRRRESAGGWRRELDTELGLATRAAQVDHDLAGDGESGLRAQVVLDQGQHEVVRGGDPGGGPHVAVAHVDGVGVDVDPGVFGLQTLAAV